MKKLLAILVSFSCLAAWADDLKTKDGTVYKNVTIVSAKPEHMLIVHDGGGIQVYFKDLVPDSLTAEQRKIVEREIKIYAERADRLEKARIEREAFELAQREKGLIEYEGIWMTPLEKEELLLKREERRLELEKQRLLLAQEKAALEREKLETERARYLLEGESNRGRTTITYGYSSSYRGDCYYVRPHYPNKRPHKPINPPKCDNIIRQGQTNPYICTDNAAFYNRSPFNR